MKGPRQDKETGKGSVCQRQLTTPLWSPQPPWVTSKQTSAWFPGVTGKFLPPEAGQTHSQHTDYFAMLKSPSVVGLYLSDRLLVQHAT